MLEKSLQVAMEGSPAPEEWLMVIPTVEEVNNECCGN
jgi:hypothetical protein